MKSLSFRQKCMTMAALSGVCGLIVVTGIGRGAAPTAGQNRPATRTSQQRLVRAQLLDGLGREVQFSKRGDSLGEAMSAVKSANRFMRERSGVSLSAVAEKRLAELEQGVVNGQRRRLSVDELTDVLTDTAVERASTITDEEIDGASRSFRVEADEEVSVRSDGRGSMRPDELVSQAKALRNLSRQNDAATRESIRLAVAEEVNNRVKSLKEGLPEHFGQVEGKGLSPSQAVLIAYSVASDDNLGTSLQRLQSLTARENRTIKESAQKSQRPDAIRPFGAQGARFSTPLDLVFDDKTVNGLLDRIERRSRQ